MVAVGFVSSEITIGNPGDCQGSIGLTSDGRILVDGSHVEPKHLPSTSVDNRWTEPFRSGIIGCGIKLSWDSKSAFTRSGFMIAPLSNFEVLDWNDSSLPSVGMTPESEVEGIFDYFVTCFGRELIPSPSSLRRNRLANHPTRIRWKLTTNFPPPCLFPLGKPGSPVSTSQMEAAVPRQATRNLSKTLFNDKVNKTTTLGPFRCNPASL